MDLSSPNRHRHTHTHTMYCEMAQSIMTLKCLIDKKATNDPSVMLAVPRNKYSSKETNRLSSVLMLIPTVHFLDKEPPREDQQTHIGKRSKTPLGKWW